MASVALIVAGRQEITLRLFGNRAGGPVTCPGAALGPGAALEGARGDGAKSIKSDARKQRSLFVLLGAGVVGFIIIAAGAWYFFGANRPTAAISSKPAHLSIVVLPVTNLSGDPRQDYFADGITENLTTDLSRIRNSFVIARNTAFTFKGKNIDTKEISKDLGVRYVLEGSVQRDQNHVRVNVQLIDGETGAHHLPTRNNERGRNCR
jgi:adenylate cyclase